MFPHFKSLSATLPLSLSSDALNVNIALDLTGFATTATSYTKDQVNNSLLQKADASTVYSKAQVDAAVLARQTHITASTPLTLSDIGALCLDSTVFAPAGQSYTKSETDATLQVKQKSITASAVSYTHLTLPTNREV